MDLGIETESATSQTNFEAAGNSALGGRTANFRGLCLSVNQWLDALIIIFSHRF